MEQFNALLRVAEALLGPNGCPWDQKQTFMSLQPYVLEEAHEVIEAVDADDEQKMIEELGDLLYTIVFYAKLGERTGRFNIEDILNAIKEKLIRRHPHVFGETKVEDADEVVKNWEMIKALEKPKKPESILDGIPPTLPALIRAQKVLKRIQRSGTSKMAHADSTPASEEQIGNELLQLIQKAEKNGVDAESALRRSLGQVEKEFRSSENR